MKNAYDIAVIGGGLVGLTTALACASKGASIVVFDRDDPIQHRGASFDGRASAIAASSYQMYRHLGIAEALKGHVQPITDILITDGETGQNPSPLSLHFDSRDVDGSPMGYMIENRKLTGALQDAVMTNPNVDFLAPVQIDDIDRQIHRASISISTGKTIEAKLIVAADGRGSFCRKSAGINVTTFPYAQKAIVTTVEHEKPHLGVAHEIFLPNGPFAILPLTGNRASIVWTDTPRAVDAAMALPEDAFAAELGRRFGTFLGAVKPCAPRWAYPLSLQMAEHYTDKSLALIGDAAHAIHPIAGQGLNMGLRDAAALADVIENARSAGLDLGGANLNEYEQWRNFDNSVLAGATDIFNRLFSNNIGPIKHARRIGLGLINSMPAARSMFIKEASGRMGELPTLLRD